MQTRVNYSLKDSSIEEFISVWCCKKRNYKYKSYIQVFEPKNSVIYGLTYGADKFELNLSVNCILASLKLARIYKSLKFSPEPKLVCNSNGSIHRKVLKDFVRV